MPEFGGAARTAQERARAERTLPHVHLPRAIAAASGLPRDDFRLSPFTHVAAPPAENELHPGIPPLPGNKTRWEERRGKQAAARRRPLASDPPHALHHHRIQP